jgi:N-acetylmuramoyl-L-alanine amidase
MRLPPFDRTLRSVLLPLVAVLAGCNGLNAPPTPAPPVHQWADLDYTSGAPALAREMGLKVKAEPGLDALALEGEDGRILFVNGTRTVLVGGKAVEVSAPCEIAGLNLPLRQADADRVKAAWRGFVKSMDGPDEVVSRPPSAHVSPPSASRRPVPAGSDPEWRVPLKRKWEGILIHHSAQPSGNMAKIDKYHREDKGWLGIGYDFLIDNGDGGPDGLVETTFRWRKQIQGAHAGEGQKRYNDHWIGICLVGDFNETRPTRAQMASLKRLIAFLQAHCDIPEGNIKFHRDLKNTECPGRNFPVREVLGDAPRAK